MMILNAYPFPKNWRKNIYQVRIREKIISKLTTNTYDYGGLVDSVLIEMSIGFEETLILLDNIKEIDNFQKLKSLFKFVHEHKIKLREL